jgi:hypothetical protein
LQKGAKGQMNEQLEYTTFIVKDLIFPIVTIIAVLFAVWTAYRRGLFSKSLSLQESFHLDTNKEMVAGSETETYDVDKFNQYHTQSLSQSRISFWFSLVFATVGFLIIASSVFIYNKESSYIGIVSGTIIDAVSALFFYQSNKARQLMSEFFDRLRADRKLEESLKLCDTIDDPIMRNSLKVKLSLYFSGLEDGYNIAASIINASIQGKMTLTEKSEDKR